MSQREASVKLTLDDGEYVVSMRKAGDESEKAGRKGAAGMKLFASGIKGARDGLSGLMGTVSKATGLVTGLAASPGVACGEIVTSPCRVLTLFTTPVGA